MSDAAQLGAVANGCGAKRLTPLDLTNPLRSLRALCGLSHRTLGERLTPPVSDVAVVKAEAKGARIKLATLAAYARAAGWRLRVEAAPSALRAELVSADADAQRAQRATTHPDADTDAGYSLGYAAGLRRAIVLLGVSPADDLDVTVAGARSLLAALGLEMSLAVEAAPNAERRRG